MKFKRGILSGLAVALLCGIFAVQTPAAETAPMVYVTVANGTPVLVQQPVSVTDADGDGALTIDDALFCAHEANFTGGAAAGYASEDSDFGRSMKKLWGVENGGSYGYYRNNASAFSLLDAIHDGDRIYAFVYTDTTSFSDMYCYFDKDSVACTAGEAVSLTLYSIGFDASFNAVVSPLAGAMLTLDGRETGVVTDGDGKATLPLKDAGSYIISATSATATLVPPVCIGMASAAVTPPTPTPTPTPEPEKQPVAEQTPVSPKTGDTAPVLFLLVSVATLAALPLVLRRKERSSH